MSQPCSLRGGLGGQEGGAWVPGSGLPADHPLPCPVGHSVSLPSPALMAQGAHPASFPPLLGRSMVSGPEGCSGPPGQVRERGVATEQGSCVRPRMTDGTQRRGLLGSRTQHPTRHVTPACIRPCRPAVMSGGGALGWTGQAVIQGHGTCMGAQSRVPPRHRETKRKVGGGSCSHRKESVQRPQSGDSPQRQGGSEFRATGQERAWRLEPDGPGGPGGGSAFPRGFGIHWGGGGQRAACHCRHLPPSAPALPVPRQPQGHEVRPSCHGQCDDGGVSCEGRGGSQSGLHMRRTRSPGRGWRGVLGRNSLSKSVEVGRYRRNVRHGQ